MSITVKVMLVMTLFDTAGKKMNFINVKQFLGSECSKNRNVGI